MYNIFKNTLLVAVLTVSALQAQTPVVQLDKVFGSSSFDLGLGIINTSDGGNLLGGYSNGGISGDKTEVSRGASDYWVLKLDNMAQKQWDKTLGGTSTDYFKAVIQTSDGGYLVGGNSSSAIGGDKTEASRGGMDYWVVKIDASGNKQWDKTMGTTAGDELCTVLQTTDGGYLLVGHTEGGATGDRSQPSKGSSDLWVVKLTNSGSVEWEKAIGGDWADYVYAAVNTLDGKVVLAGGSSSSVSFDRTSAPIGSYDLWLVKIDNSGTILWDKTYGGTADDFPRAIDLAANGDLLIGGYSNSPISGTKTAAPIGGEDFWMVRISAAGTQLWDKTFGTATNEFPAAITELVGGQIVMTGYSASGIAGDKTEGSYGGNDYWMVCADANGNKLWDKTLGGTGADEPKGLAPTLDNGFIIFGASDSPINGTKTLASKGGYDYYGVKVVHSNGTPPPPPDAKPTTHIAGGDGQSTQAGFVDGSATTARFRGPYALAYKSATGTVFVADAFNHSIRMIDNGGNVTTLAGNGTRGNTNGTGSAARFRLPTGLAYDAGTGTLYIADMGNHMIRKMNTSTLEVTTLAGTGMPGSTDGEANIATFKNPTGLTLMGGILYIADNGNHMIRQINLATGQVTTLAGNGSAGYGEGTGPSAKFNSPWHLANDGSNLYVTDKENNRIRKVTTSGTTTAYVGSGSPGFTDGSASSCRLNKPMGICIEGADLLFTDHNNRCVRRLQAGNVQTLSGTPTPGNSNGSISLYCSPAALVSNGLGKFFVLDAALHQLRRID